MIFRLGRQWVSGLVLLFAAAASGTCAAQTEPTDDAAGPTPLTATPRATVGRGAAETHLRGVAALTRPEMVEPAGAHGSIGTAIGIGTASLAKPLAVQPGADGEKSRSSLPRAWIVKGTPVPVDFAVVGGADPEAGMTAIAAIVQGTVFERPGLPALSVRAGAGKAFGIASTELKSLALEAAAGMGFLRYFQGYLVYGAKQNEGTYRETADAVAYRMKWIEPTRKVGLRVAVLPPFVTLTGEVSFRDVGGVGDWVAKVSVGM